MKTEEFAGVDQAEIFKQCSTAQILGAETEIAIGSYVDEFGSLDPERGLDLPAMGR
jgi:hypothetical protein